MIGSALVRGFGSERTGVAATGQRSPALRPARRESRSRAGAQMRKVETSKCGTTLPKPSVRQGLELSTAASTTLQCVVANQAFVGLTLLVGSDCGVCWNCRSTSQIVATLRDAGQPGSGTELPEIAWHLRFGSAPSLTSVSPLRLSLN